MPLRFCRRIHLAPGINLNLGHHGVTSLSLGGHGLTTNLNARGVGETVSLPGTGLSYQTRRMPYGALGCVVPQTPVRPWHKFAAIAVVAGFVLFFYCCAMWTNERQKVDAFYQQRAIEQQVQSMPSASPAPTSAPVPHHHHRRH